MYLFSDENTSVIPATLIASCLKLLLLNAYHSTDFEVHRNWLAITSSLPLADWYYEETSEWTLDYPPFFAWFEYALSHVAYYFDPGMLHLDNLNYATPPTKLFQRGSVIATDFLLIYSVKTYCSKFVPNTDSKLFIGKKFIVFWSIVMNFGLLIIDHIHFQYNGFLFGMFVMSVVKMLEGKHLSSAFWFAVLLNFKHIFLYIAPVYFVYLLRSYCFRRSGASVDAVSGQYEGILVVFGADLRYFLPLNLIKLGVVVVSIFTVSLGPFVYLGQLGQVASRLFPVKRGLCHAYWAANFWALYAGADKCATIVLSKLGVIGSSVGTARMTGGLVGQQSFAVLWNVPPIVTGVLTLLAMLPALKKLWYKPFARTLFVPALTLCAYASFLFGYHVHEKAVLMVIIPMTFLAIQSPFYARVFIVLCVAGHYALFPLLPREAETPIKVILFLLFTISTTAALNIVHEEKKTSLLIPFVTWYEAAYIYISLPLFLYTCLGHSVLGLESKLPFLPLMMTSLYCAVGVIWSWLLLYSHFLWVHEPPKKID